MTSALAEMRVLRRGKRLQQQEWFELWYRAYIAGICWIGGAFALSALVGDETFTPEHRADVLSYAPGITGLLAAVVIGLGLRSGSRGGPLSVEAGDVNHLLLAPLPRAVVLRRPAVQQVRLAALSGAAAGALAGTILGRRFDEPMTPWVLSTAVAGMAIAVSYVAIALLAHVIRLRGWHATVLALVLIVWQAASIPQGSDIAGPFDTAGHLVLWPDDVHWFDVSYLVGVVILAGIALALLERLSLEALDRRSALVSQLRFAVTMRDLRTVVLLRRQLMNEQHRNRPWVKLPARARFTVARRDARGFARYPLTRIARMLVLTAIAAGAQVAAYRGTTPAVIVGGLAAFVLGLECLEGFAQELDHPDNASLVPRASGWLMMRHLPASAVLGSCLAVLAAIVTALVTGSDTQGWELALLLCIPVALGGMAGAVLNTVAGVPEAMTPGSVNEMLPPEIAGFREGLRTIWPLAVATAGSLPVLAARQAAKAGHDPVPPAAQAAVAVGLLVAAVAWWTGHREQMRAKLRSLWTQGDAEFKARHGGAA